MKQIYWWLFIFAVALGIGLRIAAFFWNDRLAGDVNLFALTAREYVRHQRLDYPLKYEFTEQVPYRVLHTPASQHPPLWPFLGGSVARWLATDDTFFVLKLLCAVTGSLLLIAIVMLVNRLQWPMEERLIGLALILLSPLLTDFSANGSPYIVLALLLVLASLLFLSAQRQSPIRYAFAGLVCGVALQIHSLMFFLPVLFLYFWLQDRRRGQVNWRGVLIFAMTGLLTVLPWLWWNQQHFGRLFYSSSTNHLFSQLGLLQFVADDKGLYYRVVMQPLAVLAPVYLRLFWKSLWEFSLYFLYEVGPFWLIPFWIGCRTHWRENRHQSTILLLPVAGAAVVVLLWANAKFRFLVPLLPVAYLLAAKGCVHLHRGQPRARHLGYICLVGLFGWSACAHIWQPTTRYAAFDNPHKELTAQMQPLAKQLAHQPPGVVLGYANALDGGVETVYWHQHPHIQATGIPPQHLPRLAADFQVRYLWTDTALKASLTAIFPHAQLILSNRAFAVFEIQQ
ncbi:MAG: glycosyltransferase family 39 protein [Verrucomicrobiota bacterium]